MGGSDAQGPGGECACARQPPLLPLVIESSSKSRARCLWCRRLSACVRACVRASTRTRHLAEKSKEQSRRGRLPPACYRIQLCQDQDRAVATAQTPQAPPSSWPPLRTHSCVALPPTSSHESCTTTSLVDERAFEPPRAPFPCLVRLPDCCEATPTHSLICGHDSDSPLAVGEAKDRRLKSGL